MIWDGAFNWLAMVLITLRRRDNYETMHGGVSWKCAMIFCDSDSDGAKNVETNLVIRYTFKKAILQHDLWVEFFSLDPLIDL